MIDGLHREFGLPPERRDQFWSALHGLEPTTRVVADLSDVARAQVGNLVLLQVRPDRFDRVELGRVGRQVSKREASLLSFEPRAYLSALVDSGAIPNHQQLFADLLVQGAKELDDLFALDRTIEEAEVKAPPTQAGDGRHLLPGETLLNNRRLAAWRPGARYGALFRETRLVDEDDRSSLGFGLFFSAGQVLRFQRSMASSLRCVARFSGFCGEKPMLRSRFQQPHIEYSTSKRSLITARTRLIVQSSVANPAVSAPVSKIARSPANCSSSKRAGRPSGLALSLPIAPFFSASSEAQTLTACRETSKRRATSACGTPLLSMRAPLSRRSSIASKSRFVPMRHPRQITCRYNAQGYDSVVNHLSERQ